MGRIFVILCLGGGLLFSSCNLLDQEEEAPAFVEIQRCDLSVTDTATYGSSSSNIVDAWVFLNDNLLGAWELPATIPILASGNQRIKVKAGVKKDGLSAVRVRYDFYEAWEQTINLVKDREIVLNPVFDYDLQVVPYWMEDFEGLGISLENYVGGTATMEINSNPQFVLEGNGSGEVILTPQASYVNMISTIPVSLKNGLPANMELNFSCDVDLYVEMVGFFTGSIKRDEVVTLLSTTSEGGVIWKKIYLDLSDNLNNIGQANEYKIVFWAMLPEGRSSGRIMIDNIKLLSI